MIANAMYVMLGALLASLAGLLLAPTLWRRAVRLTTRRLEAAMPMSLADIRADKDHLRAAFAVEIRRLEMALEKSRNRAARAQVERGRAQARIEDLAGEVKSLRAELGERVNELSVLEQTVRRRLPSLEAQIKELAAVLGARERELRRLSAAFTNQAERLAQTQADAQKRAEEVERLRRALEGERSALAGFRRRRAATPENRDLQAQNQRLIAELSRANEYVERLQEEALRDTDLLKFELRSLAEQIMAAAGQRAGEAPYEQIIAPAHAAARPRPARDGTAGPGLAAFTADGGTSAMEAATVYVDQVDIAAPAPRPEVDRLIEPAAPADSQPGRARRWARKLTGRRPVLRPDARAPAPEGSPQPLRPSADSSLSERLERLAESERG